MPRINGLFKIFIALLLTFSLTGFLCEDTSDDDPSCSDAAKNMANIIDAEYGLDPVTVCAALDTIFDMDPADVADCEALVTAEGKDGLITGLAAACKEDDWPQSVINCVDDAGTWSDLEACAP